MGVDMKEEALELMRARASAAGLSNVQTFHGTIASFGRAVEGTEGVQMASYGTVMALHACGQASDEAILRAVRPLISREKSVHFPGKICAFLHPHMPVRGVGLASENAAEVVRCPGGAPRPLPRSPVLYW